MADWAGAAWVTTRDFDWTYLAPFVSEEVAGIDILKNGDIVVCDEGNGAIQKITPCFGTSGKGPTRRTPNIGRKASLTTLFRQS